MADARGSQHSHQELSAALDSGAILVVGLRAEIRRASGATNAAFRRRGSEEPHIVDVHRARPAVDYGGVEHDAYVIDRARLGEGKVEMIPSIEL